ncbi:MAG: sulfatase-like hydrolase/transferase, partial [Thermoanaerobaculia bacterium]|nr:sulfatase-like hydrolase/transferase [Thermoanaerobaculia bacterium]
MTTLPHDPGVPRQTWLRALHALTLSCLAFTQPILDLLGRTAEFLVIRRIGPLDLFTLLGLLVVVVPLPFVVIVILGERMGGKTGRILVGVVIGLLAGLVALRIESAASLLDGLPAVVAAVFAGLCAAVLYLRYTTFRSFVTYLSPALLVVPAFFMLQTDVRRAVFPQHQSSALAASGARAPIFFLIFDELSFASIVDEQGLVDATRYPNLARLAGDATWYRNAHTVADTTNVALPAMLASRFPSSDDLPLLADYPENIFTLFGGDYRIWADEPITRLCPTEINIRGQFAPPAARRFTALGLDLSIVWLHLALPPSYRLQLPSIANTWEGFTEGARRAAATVAPRVEPKDASEFFSLAVSELTHGNRAERFRELLANIDPGHDRSLYFSHVMLPHVPWEYLPSGRLYSQDSGRVPGLISEVWQDDPAPVRLAAVRYLMQVEFLDRLVGELIGKLEQERLYEKSLIVLVADHGSSFRAGDKRRAYSPGNAADIIPVPLIIKAPGQSRGEIVDVPVSTLDILPTIMDILDIETPAAFEGRSTRSARPEAPRTTIVSTKYEGEQSLVISELTVKKYESARALAGMIGPPSDPYRFSRAAPNADVLGRAVASLPVRNGTLRATLFDEAAYRSFDPDAARLPSLVTGAVRPEGTDCCDLALAVNGRIVATARTRPVTGELHHFSAILSEQILQNGLGEVRLFRVLATDRSPTMGPVLEATVSGRQRSYSIQTDGLGRTQSLIVDGKEYVPGRKLDGWIEAIDVEGDTLKI